MPTYVDPAAGRVHVVPHGQPPPSGLKVLDGETAERLAGVLQDGQLVTRHQIRLLLEGNVGGFIRSLDADYVEPEPQAEVEEESVHEPVVEVPTLPPTGLWQYRVVAVPERTIVGTAHDRIALILNSYAANGWELATTTTTETWMVGDRILLTLRRFVTTEEMFAERFRAEERIRRQVLAEFED